MLDSDTGRVFVCNEVGFLIWSRLSRRLSIETILDEIVLSYDVEPERAKHDIQTFLAQVQRHGLLARGANKR